MNKDLSMIKVVEQLLIKNEAPLELAAIFKEVAEVKGFPETDYETLNQLYLDIVMSASFVYIGQGFWDLKERNLEYWAKDGTDFISESTPAEGEGVEGYKEVNFTSVAQEKIESIIGLDRVEDEFDLDELDDLDGVEFDLDELEDLDEEEKRAILEEKQYIADDIALVSTDEEDDVDVDLDDLESEDYDEDSYHEIMDEYEDLY